VLFLLLLAQCTLQNLQWGLTNRRASVSGTQVCSSKCKALIIIIIIIIIIQSGVLSYVGTADSGRSPRLRPRPPRPRGWGLGALFF